MKTSYPKIGIRPIIDGRRKGIRKSLEETTMNLGKRVEKLYTETLKYPDRSPVQCVIADTCIGGVKEASLCAEKFTRDNVGLSLSVSSYWCYGSESIDMNPNIPKAIWEFNETERPGAVYLAAALAIHNQKGLPTFGIYGRDDQDVGNLTIPEDVKEKLLRFARTGLAVAQMKGKSYLANGSVSMGIGGSMVNPDFLQEYLGMRTEFVDSGLYSVMNYWGANYGAISYGHIGADLITLCSAISIPINMHNVDKDKIFRSSTWSSIGADNEGADYRACVTFSPLFK